MPAEIATEYLNLLVEAVLVVRLVQLDLFSKYRVFVIYLAYDLVLTVTYLAVTSPHFFPLLHLDYRVVWLAERPLAWLLQLSMVYVLLHRVMESQSGLLRLSRRIFYVGCAAAVVLAFFGARVEAAVAPLHPSSTVAILSLQAVIIERACLTTVLLLLLGTFSFLLWFPVSVSKNVAFLAGGLLAYFTAANAGMLLVNVWGIGNWRFLGVLEYVCQTAVLLTWLFYLSPRGEQVVVRPGHSWHPSEQARIVAQMEAINAALLRSAKRSHPSTNV